MSFETNIISIILVPRNVVPLTARHMSILLQITVGRQITILDMY